MSVHQRQVTYSAGTKDLSYGLFKKFNLIKKFTLEYFQIDLNNVKFESISRVNTTLTFSI